MLLLVKSWRNKASAIRKAVQMIKDLAEDVGDGSDAEPDSVMLKREELELKEHTLVKTASIYDECADELEKKLWEVV
jgi:hypothetical protein